MLRRTRLYRCHFRASRVKSETYFTQSTQPVAARAETKLQSPGWVAQLRRPGWDQSSEFSSDEEKKERSALISRPIRGGGLLLVPAVSVSRWHPLITLC